MHYFWNIQFYSLESSASVTLHSPFFLCLRVRLRLCPVTTTSMWWSPVWSQETFLLCRWGHWVRFSTSLFYIAHIYIALLAAYHCALLACCLLLPVILVPLPVWYASLVHTCFGNHVFSARVFAPGTRTSLHGLPLALDVWSCIRMLQGCPNEPSSRICSILSSIRVSLQINGGEFILPLITITLATVSRVLLLIAVVNSPFTGSSCCRVLSLISLLFKIGFLTDLLNKTLDFCSSIRLISAPLSGSALTSAPLILMTTVFWKSLIFFTFFSWPRCFNTAWSKYSSIELRELSDSTFAIFLTPSSSLCCFAAACLASGVHGFASTDCLKVILFQTVSTLLPVRRAFSSWWVVHLIATATIIAYLALNSCWLIPELISRIIADLRYRHTFRFQFHVPNLYWRVLHLRCFWEKTTKVPVFTDPFLYQNQIVCCLNYVV